MHTTETSDHDPSVTPFGADFCVAWTGTGGGHNLNVATYFPTPSPLFDKETFGDSSRFGPSLTMRRHAGQYANVPDVLQLLIAWTGEDEAGTLNSAMVRELQAS
ncbi:MAG: hypothetical protein WBM50_19205 [Acidimicrobiales bacterium]